MKIVGFVFWLLVALVAVFLMMRLRAPEQSEVRSIWVTRFDYASPEDVRRIFSNLAGVGFTDVFFQVRGYGTVYFDSALEPWAYELSGGDLARLGTHPGWDPLRLAVGLAHERGMRLHAYINVLPGWLGHKLPPRGATQLWTEHPDWFMVDETGAKMQPVSGWYSFVNPSHPDVREHLRGLVSELCEYAIDGLHLDYIRFPYDYHLVAGKLYPKADAAELRRRSSFSFDSVSLQQLHERYGELPSKLERDDFRRDAVSRVVRDLAYLAKARRGNQFLVSAAVLGNPDEGRRFAFQDSGLWVRQQAVDWAVQMNYGAGQFDAYLGAMRQSTGKRGFRRSVVVGLSCEHGVAELKRQMERIGQSGCRGYALFSYGLLFDGQHRPTQKGQALFEMLRLSHAGAL